MPRAKPLPPSSDGGPPLKRWERSLAQRPSLTPPGRAPDHLRVATWNLNSLRARLAGVERFLDRVHPDVLCLQETKAPALTDAALAAFERHGYTAVHAGAGGYNGVAIAARHPLTDVVPSGDFGDEHLDKEPRAISAVAAGVRFVSLYVPHGREVGHWHYDYKLAFLRSLAGRVARWRAEEPDVHLVLTGDVNVAPTDSDVFHPDAFVGSTHVTPAEREALAGVLTAGDLVDVDVARWGARARRFTWWNHGISYSRDLGMRIDLIAADAGLAGRLETTWIDHEERGLEKPSDHAALIADFRLTPP